MPRPLKKVSGGAGTVSDELDAPWPIRETDGVVQRTDKLRARAAHKAEALATNAPATVLVVVEPLLSVLVSDIHVDGLGRLVCTVEHPSIPRGANPFIFVNPPIIHNGVEDLNEAFRQMVRDAVRAVL